MEEEAHLKPLCDLLFDCNLDASVIYSNLTSLWKKGIRLKPGDPKVLSVELQDEHLVEKRIQLVSQIQQMKCKLLSLQSVAAIILMDVLAIYEQDIDLMVTLTHKFTLYYGSNHPRVAFKLYQVATLSSDCHLKHKLLTEARKICIISSPSLVSFVDLAIKETQEQLKAQIKVKNSKSKWLPSNKNNHSYSYSYNYNNSNNIYSSGSSTLNNYNNYNGQITVKYDHVISERKRSPFEFYGYTRTKPRYF